MDGLTFLGVRVDGETDGQPNGTATGDDVNADDEDGVSFLATGLLVGQIQSVTVTGTGGAKLNAWIDFNHDGDWDDAGEQVATDLATTGVAQNVSFSVPATATLGLTFARFRLDTAGGLLPTGLAVNGEVEDYQVAIETPPTVTINQAAGQTDPSNAIQFTVVFSEAVSGFGTGDVTLGGTANPTTGTVTESAPHDGTTYLVAVSGMSNDGTVIASLAPGIAIDSAGNANFASTSTDNTVTFDGTPPTVTINQASGQADPATTADPVLFTAAFSEAVSGFTTGDVTLSGTAGATTATVTEVAPMDGTTYQVSVSGMTSTGTVTATLGAGVASDVAGNGNVASTSTDNTVTFTPPTVTLSLDQATIAETGGVATVTATLSRVFPLAVTVNLGLSGTASGGGRLHAEC